MKYLEGVKVGDRLWNIMKQEWEEVTYISNDEDSVYPLLVNGIRGS